MPATVALLAIPRVLEALRARLLADAQLTAQLSTAPPRLGSGPAIYAEGIVPAEARTDYLTIGPFTERNESTMGPGPKWGSALTTQMKLVTLSPDATKNFATLERLVGLLHGTPLAVAGYSHGSITLDLVVDAYEETVAGEVLRHYPTLWSIHVGQPR